MSKTNLAPTAVVVFFSSLEFAPQKKRWFVPPLVNLNIADLFLFFGIII